MDVCILSATAKGEQQVFRLAEGEVATFGRSSTCAFRVSDAKVSRQHCLLGFRNGVLEVTDLGSSNDLKHRGERKAHFEVLPGDGFHAGKTYVAFVRIESEGGAASVDPVVLPQAGIPPLAVDESEEVEELGGSEVVEDISAESLAFAPSRYEPFVGEPANGAVIGNYQIMSLLGRSDRCAAFVAEHVQLRRRVAIKWLRRDDTDAVATFLADMRKAAAVSSPFFLSVYDIEPDGETRYAAMELPAGRSVAAYLQDGPRLSWQETAAVVADALRALAVLHAAQQVHCGVKAENVFVLNRGGAKLSDVRAEARLRSDEWTACAAPELSRRGVASVRSDLYSVGAVAFAAITGGLSLLDGRGGRVDAAKMLARDASLPQSLVEWICAMVDEDPAYRPVSAQQALDALLAVDANARLPRATWAEARPVPPAAATNAPAEPVAPQRSQKPRQEPSSPRPQRPQASPTKVFFARLTGEMIVFTIILACGIALLLLLKIKFPDFDIYRLIGRDK